ncbi:MAG: alkaline phosphatase family protein [Polyangiaceae bacterium]
MTVDGVRWQEIFTGEDPQLAGAAAPGRELASARALTPHLHRLFFDGGTVFGDPRTGQPFLATGPRYVSLPAYVEIMTGRASGCAGNDCQPALPWTLAGQLAHPASPNDTAVFASWPTIALALPQGDDLHLSTGRHQNDGADGDTAFPGHGDYRPDARTAPLALAHLVRHRPRMLWIALGDTDEHAHRGDYPAYLDALRFADAFVGQLCAQLDRMGDYGRRTTVLVTTDHGRDPGFTDHGGPDSAPVWLMARGGPLPSKGPQGLTRPRYLRDIAPTVARLYGLGSASCDTCGAVLDELL